MIAGRPVDIKAIGPSYTLRMRTRLKYVLVAGLTLFLVSPAFATLNFPNLYGYGTSYYTQAQTFDTNYTQFAKAFSNYYGEAAAFASYLSAPVGRDNLGKFPGLYVGIGIGATAGRSTQFKNEMPSSIQSSAPGYLIADTISFNFGIGFTKQWDVRFSFFPNASFNLPSSLTGSNYSVQTSAGVYRARVGYHILEGGSFKPGLTLAGFASYTTSTTSLSYTGLDQTSTDSTGTTRVVANANAKFSGQYLGIGPEIKLWYEVWRVFHPFVGYSLGLQFGQFTTSLDVAGTITVTPTGFSSQSDTGNITISERVATKLYTHRLMFGFEISLFVLDIGVEAQVDLVSGLVGAAVGTGLRF